ncbi:murein biosynthesis integral membrane protein MurJ [Runella sp.]|uniref:murein biosynthesis integral membrane protein MurJ n=1 Tax=Runella sp. TaxID=1960881 RepID=UPI003D1044AC
MSLDYRNIGVLFSLNTLNIFLNVVVSTLTVYIFGTSPKVEAFFAASLLGTAVSRFVNTGQLIEIVVSRYHRTKQEAGKNAAMSIIATLCNYMTGIALLLTLGFIAGGTGIINLLVPGFKEETKWGIWQIYCITGFLMPVQIATNLFQGLLNAENIYGKVEFTNTVSLLTNVLILAVWGNSENVTSLIVGLVISVLAQFFTVIYYLRQIGYRHSWLLRNPYFPLRDLAKTLSATSTYMVSVQLYIFLFNAALSLLPPGSFAIYRYAEIIYGKVASVFMIPVSTVFFNEINRLLNQNNGQSIKAFVSKNLNFSFFIGFMILLPFWAGGKYLLWTLWGGAKFNAQDVTAVYELLCIFFLSMIWSGPYMIYRKLAVSVVRPELLYYYWSALHVFSALIGYATIRMLGFNGVMVQVFLHSFLMCLVPILTVWYRKRVYFGFYELKEIIKITLALLAGAGAVWGFNNYWGEVFDYDKIKSFFVGFLSISIAGIVFIASTLLLKVHDINLISNKILNRMK